MNTHLTRQSRSLITQTVFITDILHYCFAYLARIDPSTTDMPIRDYFVIITVGLLLNLDWHRHMQHGIHTYGSSNYVLALCSMPMLLCTTFIITLKIIETVNNQVEQ